MMIQAIFITDSPARLAALHRQFSQTAAWVRAVRSYHYENIDYHWVAHEIAFLCPQDLSAFAVAFGFASANL